MSCCNTSIENLRVFLSICIKSCLTDTNSFYQRDLKTFSNRQSYTNLIDLIYIFLSLGVRVCLLLKMAMAESKSNLILSFNRIQIYSHVIDKISFVVVIFFFCWERVRMCKNKALSSTDILLPLYGFYAGFPHLNFCLLTRLFFLSLSPSHDLLSNWHRFQ